MTPYRRQLSKLPEAPAERLFLKPGDGVGLRVSILNQPHRLLATGAKQILLSYFLPASPIGVRTFTSIPEA